MDNHLWGEREVVHAHPIVQDLDFLHTFNSIQPIFVIWGTQNQKYPIVNEVALAKLETLFPLLIIIFIPRRDFVLKCSMRHW